MVKLTGTLGLYCEAWRTVPSDSSVLIFASTEVDWPLNAVSVAFLWTFGYYCRTDHMSSRSDVEE